MPSRTTASQTRFRERKDSHLMITPELIARINELARKKRSEGLSDAETAEQAALRRDYLDSIREQVTQLLDSIKLPEDPADYDAETDIDLSHRIMDFQEEMRRPFVDNEHIH